MKKAAIRVIFTIILVTFLNVGLAHEYFIRVIVLDSESEVPISDAKVRLDYYPGYSRQSLQITDEEGIADLLAGSDDDDSYLRPSDCTERHPKWADQYWACETTDRKDIHISHPEYKVIKGSLSWKTLYVDDDGFFSGKGLGISHGGSDIFNAYPPIIDEYGDRVERGDFCEIIAYMSPIPRRR
jgi:hypothetical protein